MSDTQVLLIKVETKKDIFPEYIVHDIQDIQDVLATELIEIRSKW